MSTKLMLTTALALGICGLALALPGQSTGQTTTCRRFGDEVTCSTNNGAADFIAAVEARRAREAAEEAHRRASIEAYEARRDREEAAAEAAYVNKHLADLIQAGKCDEAQAFALRKGKMDAVEVILKICHAAAAQP
jgi:hypothetical protein